jgi:MinD superfamily P-loop ATPase
MGRDGIGKTSIAKAVAGYLARDDLTLIVNTDMTLPTTIRQDSGLRSLGHYLSLASRQPVAPYLQQHEKIRNLFFAGTSMLDDVFSYPVDLDNAQQAGYFIEEALKEVSHIVIDLSGQSMDPFLPVSVERADLPLFMTSCDAEGINSLYAMQRLFKSSACPVRMALSKTQAWHDISAFEKTSGRRVEYNFPFSNELLYAAACGRDFAKEGKTSKLWDKEVRKVADDLLVLGKQEDGNG